MGGREVAAAGREERWKTAGKTLALWMGWRRGRTRGLWVNGGRSAS